MLATSLFDYELPPELIARYPAAHRDGSRMMVLDRKTGHAEIHPFTDIVNYLSSGDAIICNNTKVCRGRMFARKAGLADGAKFEILLVEPFNGIPGEWNCMIKPGKRAKDGTHAVLLEQDGSLNADGIGFTVVERNGDDTFHIKFDLDDDNTLQQRFGHIPLPPYLNREAEPEDDERYQTVYAAVPGAVAAPTAGLHFTPEIFEQAREKGVSVGELTLHVGPGTFRPVKTEDIEDHHMDFEAFTVPPETAEAINACKARGGRVVCVGSTTVRTLETVACRERAEDDPLVAPGSGASNIFIYPPYDFKVCDAMLTNFHLPQSTLLMMVSALAGRERILCAYAFAVRKDYQFFSYGDCMLIV